MSTKKLDIDKMPLDKCRIMIYYCRKSTREGVRGVYEDKQLAEAYKEARRLVGVPPPESNIRPEEREERKYRRREWREIVIFGSAALSSSALIGILIQLTLKNAGLF